MKLKTLLLSMILPACVAVQSMAAEQGRDTLFTPVRET